MTFSILTILIAILIIVIGTSYFKIHPFLVLLFATLILAEILVRYSGKSLDFALAYYLAPLILIPIVYLILVRKLYYVNLKK